MKLVLSFFCAFMLVLAVAPVSAEYADVVMNKRAEKEGVRPVIFPHWFHRIRFQCRVCHAEIGFKMKAGTNDFTMNEVIDGKFCGACHNNDIAWGPDRCELCHSGKPGLAAGVMRGHQTSGPGRY